MTITRTTVLVGVLVLLSLVTAGILAGVLATVFFAITVAYVLLPAYRWIVVRGVPRWWAAAATTVATFLASFVLLLPVGVVLYLRRRELVSVLLDLPESVPVRAFGVRYVVDTGRALDLVAGSLSRFAVGIAREAPVVGVKAFLFAIVVFALLLRGPELRRALLGPVPGRYHDVALAVNDRIRSTLFALYVLQAATAAGTFLVALPLFAALGYGFPITLAVVAAVLQFLPIVGPSLLIVALVVLEVTAGAYAKAVLVGALGIALVGVLPDAVIRPRLAREVAHLPGSLYFVGFTGGLLSLGPVGIIAGPLAVAVLAEVLSILDGEVRSAGPDGA